MEDIVRTLVDVVRAQKTAMEGSDEKPFDIEDIIDMTLNISGRPEDPEKEREMAESIQKMAESMAPDIFPPKTFEEMDDSERAVSAVNMIEERLRQGGISRGISGLRPTPADDGSVFSGNSDLPDKAAEKSSDSTNVSAFSGSVASESGSSDNGGASGSSASDAVSPDYGNGTSPSLFGEDDFNAREAADLNDIIYKNFMQMMGLNEPKVEYPFDRSQIRYGREKSATQMLQEEAEEKAAQQERESRGPVSAWELAQAAIDKDEEAHHKEEPEKKEMEMPQTKSASQLAAEAIARAQEEDKMKMEAEKRAERLMEEARKRGKDPMEFALHQQEILNYMEKNSDELVSFEDYEDLSPEEKLEIERQLYREKQLAAGVAPEDIPDVLPDEVIEQAGVVAPEAEGGDAVQEGTPSTGQIAADGAASDGAENGGQRTQTDVQGTQSGGQKSDSAPTVPGFSDEMLRQISAEVVGENESMILEEDPHADLDSINETIFQNLKQLMESTDGGSVTQEDLETLIGEVITRNAEPEETPEIASASYENEEASPSSVPSAAEENSAGVDGTPAHEPMSAVELARAAQAAAKPEPREVKEGKSAVELARQAQENARKNAEKELEKEPEETPDSEELCEEDLDFDEIELFGEDADSAAEESESPEDADSAESIDDGGESGSTEIKEESETAEEVKDVERSADVGESDLDETEDEPETTETSEEEEYEYVNPDELVLGEHTQAEIDEAMENLASLGLEGEVYERAKRMLLLELAGSEAALDAWLHEQESGKKKKAAVSALDLDEEGNLDDLDDLDEDELERELALAMEEDFVPETDGDGPDWADAKTETEEESETAEEDGAAGTEKSEMAEENGAEGTEKSETAEEYVSEGLEDVRVEKTRPEKDESVVLERKREKTMRSGSHRIVVKRKEKTTGKKEDRRTVKMAPAEIQAQKKEFQVSVSHPFALKNSANYMDKLEEYIADTQENRRLSTGFQRLDAMLRYGLHKGSYFIDANPQYLKNGFMQQMADRAAENGVDVLYISTEMSRYDLMVESLSRLSYELGGRDESKAVSAMAIMTGEEGASLASLEDELNWYRGRISEHLFILDQEAVEEYVESMENVSAGAILEELIRSMVTEGAHKPAVFIDNIENILSAEDSEDMKPLMDGIKKLAGELGIPILLSYGYAQAESDGELYPEEESFHASLGAMCDVYMELKYADMITEDYQEITPEDIREMAENGELLLVDVLLHRNRKDIKASCQIQAAPKFNYFEE